MANHLATPPTASVSSSATASAASLSDTLPLPPNEGLEEEIASSRSIPQNWRASFSAWWGSDATEKDNSELRILRRLPFFRTANQSDPTPTPEDPDPLSARVSHIALNKNPKRYLNTVTFTKPSLESPGASKNAVVLLHGYGAGLGFFYLNWETIARAATSIGRKAYAVDWLGMGRSARPDPKELDAGKKATVEERVDKAESFFTDSLEQWRQELGIEKMTLIGHSLGGYLSTVYALKYPNRVDRLILLSPVGIPEHPDKPQDVPNPAPANAERELNEPQKETTGGKQGEGDVKKIGEKDPGDGQVKKKVPQTRRMQVFTYLWEQGVSPFSILRGMGPWAPMMVSRYSSRRFGALPEDDIRDLHWYIYTISTAKGSSEYCISHLLEPGAYARMPLVNRVNQLRVPVTFAYGDHDWMDSKGGTEAVRRLEAVGNNQSQTVIVENAGHHLYLDNATVTNKLLREEIAKVAKTEKA